jgi:hypothetical protein
MKKTFLITTACLGLFLMSFKSAEENFILKDNNGVYFIPLSNNISSEDAAKIAQVSKEGGEDFNSFVYNGEVHNLNIQDLKTASETLGVNFGDGGNNELIGAIIFKRGFVVVARKKDATDCVIICSSGSQMVGPGNPAYDQLNSIFSKYEIKAVQN